MSTIVMFGEDEASASLACYLEVLEVKTVDGFVHLSVKTKPSNFFLDLAPGKQYFATFTEARNDNAAIR